MPKTMEQEKSTLVEALFFTLGEGVKLIVKGVDRLYKGATSDNVKWKEAAYSSLIDALRRHDVLLGNSEESIQAHVIRLVNMHRDATRSVNLKRCSNCGSFQAGETR